MIKCEITVQVSYPPVSLVPGSPQDGERAAQHETGERLLQYLSSPAFKEAVKNQVEALVRQEPAIACCDVEVEVTPHP